MMVKKLLAKLAVAGVLAGASLFLVPPGDALIISCCRQCQGMGSICVKNCGGNFACQRACNADYEACSERCAPEEICP